MTFIFSELQRVWNSAEKVGEKNIVNILKPFESSEEYISSLFECH